MIAIFVLLTTGNGLTGFGAGIDGPQKDKASRQVTLCLGSPHIPSHPIASNKYALRKFLFSFSG